MKYLSTTFLFILIFLSVSYAQEWKWAKSIKGPDGDVGIIESVIDTEGNICVFGYFTDKIADINNEANIINTAGDHDLFLAKFEQNGNPIWVRYIQSAGKDVAKAITVDQNNNIYILGDFKDNDCTFPSVSNTVTILNQGKFDIFMAKYDSDGEVLWAKNVAWGTVANVGGAIHIDETLNRVIFSGSYWSSTNNFGDDFVTPVATLTPLVRNGMFIASLDTDGNYITNSNVEMPNSEGRGNIIDINYYNNAYYFIGKYNDQIQLETTLLSTDANEQDAFIYKTDLNFNETWVSRIHGSSLDYISSSIVTPDGIFAGGYTSSPDLTYESTTAAAGTDNFSGTFQDIFTLKYDFDGNYVNSNAYPGKANNIINSTSFFGSNILFSGGFKDSLIIGADTLNSLNATQNDVFWIAADSDVNEIYAEQTTGAGDDKSVTAYIDNDDNLFISGTFHSDPINFDSEYGFDTTLFVTTVPFSDGFIAKHELCSDFDVRFFAVNASCPSSNDGSLTALVFSDTTASADTVRFHFDYLWSTTEITDTINNLVVGEYTLELTSEKGCVYLDTFNLVNDPILTTQLTDTVTLNCFYNVLASDTVFATLGQRPYTYLWSGGLGTDSVATNLPVGTHYVTVTDACGIDIVDTIKIGHIPTLTSNISTHNTIIACANGNDGEAWMNTNNGYGTITYTWENSASTGYIASDLDIGLHHVTVTDGCISIVDSVNVVNLPTMNANISGSTPVTCTGNTDGQATTFVVGGVEPYAFVWSSTEISANATMLPEGMAYVTVTDACGSMIDSIEITVEPSMTLQTSANHETCSGGNGEVIVIASNGSGNYSFAWDTLPSAGAPISTNDTVSNLSANTYYVTVTDACGSKTDSIVLTTNALLEAILSSHSEVLSCDTSTNGSVSVIASNGVMPYTYTWSSSASTSSIASDLSVGIEYVTVTDQCGTTIVDSLQIGFYPKLVAFAEFMSDASCLTTNDGKASVIATGGVQPYSYTWSNSSETSNIASDLPSGLQYITVTDYCGEAIDSVQISALPALTYDLTPSPEQCSGDSLGFILATTYNGVAPYSFDWGLSSNLDTNYIDSLWSGMHYVTVTDFCNTPMADSVEIETSEALIANLTDNAYTVMCESSTNGRSELIVSGGLAPYTFEWSNGASTSIADDLSIGLHYASVTDQCNDTIVDSIYVSHLPAIVVSMNTNDPLCYNDTNGTIELEISQGIHPFIVAWEDINNNDMSQDSLLFGTYKFSVTDQCGTYIDSVTLENPDSLLISATLTDESSSDLSDGSILLMVNGGTSPYQYIWNNSETSQDLVSIPAGTYTVTVTDYNQCSVLGSFEISTKVETIEAVDAFTPNGDGVNEVWTIKNIEKFPSSVVKIFNQWGNLVFESTGYDEPWDGTSNGSELSAGVYYYIIDLKDGNDAQSGSITIIR